MKQLLSLAAGLGMLFSFCAGTASPAMQNTPSYSAAAYSALTAADETTTTVPAVTETTPQTTAETTGTTVTTATGQTVPFVTFTTPDWDHTNRIFSVGVKTDYTKKYHAGDTVSFLITVSFINKQYEKECEFEITVTDGQNRETTMPLFYKTDGSGQCMYTYTVTEQDAKNGSVMFQLKADSPEFGEAYSIPSIRTEYIPVTTVSETTESGTDTTVSTTVSDTSTSSSTSLTTSSSSSTTTTTTTTSTTASTTIHTSTSTTTSTTTSYWWTSTTFSSSYSYTTTTTTSGTTTAPVPTAEAGVYELLNGKWVPIRESATVRLEKRYTYGGRKEVLSTWNIAQSNPHTVTVQGNPNDSQNPFTLYTVMDTLPHGFSFNGSTASAECAWTWDGFRYQHGNITLTREKYIDSKFPMEGTYSVTIGVIDWETKEPFPGLDVSCISKKTGQEVMSWNTSEYPEMTIKNLSYRFEDWKMEDQYQYTILVKNLPANASINGAVSGTANRLTLRYTENYMEKSGKNINFDLEIVTQEALERSISGKSPASRLTAAQQKKTDLPETGHNTLTEIMAAAGALLLAAAGVKVLHDAEKKPKHK